MVITLTTDFGAGSSYVAQMKGVMLSIAPAVTLVDVSHDVPAQQIRAGAGLLASVSPRFPAGSIHLAVIDPGVGTARRILAGRIDQRYYVAPDNGLLARVVAAGIHTGNAVELVELTQPEFWLPAVSHTFHGRDIMAPVAAHLAAGVALERLGPPASIESLTPLPWPEPVATTGQIAGQVLSIDPFGNLISNIPAELLPPNVKKSRLRVSCAGVEATGLLRTYGDRGEGEWIALVGSDGMLELAIARGNAARQLGAKVDDAFVVDW